MFDIIPWFYINLKRIEKSVHDSFSSTCPKRFSFEMFKYLPLLSPRFDDALYNLSFQCNFIVHIFFATSRTPWLLAVTSWRGILRWHPAVTSCCDILPWHPPVIVYGVILFWLTAVTRCCDIVSSTPAVTFCRDILLWHLCVISWACLLWQRVVTSWCDWLL